VSREPLRSDGGADPSLSALVFERLTLEGETTTRTTLSALSTHSGGDEPGDSRFSDLSVVVVRAGRPRRTDRLTCARTDHRTMDESPTPPGARTP